MVSSWVDGRNGGRYRLVQDSTEEAHRRSQQILHNSLLLSKSIGVCCEDLVIGCGAGGAPSHIRNIAGNSNRMNEMELTLVH